MMTAVEARFPGCAVLVLVASTSCAPRVERPMTVREVASPAGPGSGEPNLAVAPDGRVLLSWIEASGDRHRLLFSTLGDAGSWSAPLTIAEGAGWFVNWADFPALALVHNDYKHDNLVLDPADPAQIRAVLDWEMATIGDPLLDLGTTLGYWVEAGDPEELRRFAFGPTALPGTPSRAELAELYAAASGRDLARLPFYYAFGLFKIAVIAQQIYYRYRQGLTRDPRFAGLLPAIRALGRQAERAISGPR